MPVVIVRAQKVADPAGLLEAIRVRLADSLQGSPANVWAQWAPPSAVSDGWTEEPGYRVIVTIMADPRPEELVARGLSAVGEAVAEQLGIPTTSVWVHWQDLPPKTKWTGGVVR